MTGQTPDQIKNPIVKAHHDTMSKLGHEIAEELGLSHKQRKRRWKDGYTSRRSFKNGREK